MGIVGYGYVGKAMYELFKNHYEMKIYDPYYEKSNTKEEINACDVAIVCVPTPDKDERCDLSIIEETIAWLNTPLILIKSTVLPGTTECLRKRHGKRIVFSPEFLGEGNYFVPPWKYPHPTEAKYHTFQIFGGEKEDTTEMVAIFQPIMGAHVTYAQTDSTTAELVKYMENTWAAAKVTFCNEWYDIAKTFGADYNEIRELFLLDSRVEEMHTMVFPKKRGFSGKCLPKDLNAIIAASEDKNYSPELLKEVKKTNDKFRAK